jgi:hypothetical protein
LYYRKRAKMPWLQDENQGNVGNLNNVRRKDTSRHFSNKKRENPKIKINELETNSKNKNNRDMYWGLNYF